MVKDGKAAADAVTAIARHHRLFGRNLGRSQGWPSIAGAHHFFAFTGSGSGDQGKRHGAWRPVVVKQATRMKPRAPEPERSAHKRKDRGEAVSAIAGVLNGSASAR